MLTCICQKISPITTQARFIILSSQKETVRASNTGRLLKLINPRATDIILWERKQPSADLLERLRHHANAYLVFPPESETGKSRAVSRVSGPAPLFILLDGTWQEARKIARKSEYLDSLPLLAFPEDVSSGYTLREGQKSGSLCTIEAAMECLELSAEWACAQQLRQAFDLFQQHYLAGLSGHRVKASNWPPSLRRA